MVQLPSQFNPSAPGQKGVDDFTPLAIGSYQMHVRDSKMVPVKDKPNHAFLQITWEVLSGELAGSTMIQRLNLANSNPQAVEIANKHLKSICDAMGVVGVISDSQVLHGKPIWCSVTHTKPTAQYGVGNDISKYAPIGGAVPSVPTTAVAGAAPGVVGVAPAAAVPIANSPWAGAATVGAVDGAPAAPAPAVAEVAPAVATAPAVETSAVEETPPWVKQ